MKKKDLSSLKKCKLLEKAPEDVLTQLLTSSKYSIKTYKNGETVFSPESFEKSVAVILKGSLEVSKETEKGTLFMNTLSEGNIFGMSTVFCDAQAFPTTLRAREASRLLFIGKEQLTVLLSTYPEILTSYLGILSTKIHFLNKKIESISAPDAKEALRAYLNDLKTKNNSQVFQLPVSYQRLSQILGIGRTSVYRAFDELIKEGFIEKDGKAINIKQ